MNNLSISIVKYRWIIVFLTILMFLGLASGAKNLMVSTSYEVFFGVDNPELIAYEKIKSNYTNTDNLVYVVVPKNGETIYSNEVMSAVYDLTEASWGLPYSNRVDSITNYQHTYVKGDDLLVESLLEDKSLLSSRKLQEIEQIGINEPSLLHSVIPDNGNSTAVYVTFNLPNETPKEVEELIEKSDILIAEVLKKHPSVEIKPIGLTMLSYTYGKAAKADMKKLTPLMFLIVLTVLVIFLRSFNMIFSAVVVIIFTMIASLGAIGWLGFKITTVTAIGPTIIMGLVVAQCVHILVGIRQAYKKGAEKKDAVIESLNSNIKPVFVTSLTTIIGFLVMNFNDVPPYRDLGNFMAIAVSISFLLSIFFLPALISIFPMFKVKKVIENTRASDLLVGFSEFIIKNPKKIVVAFIAINIAAIFLIPQNILNEKFIEQFDESFQYRKDNDFFTENLSGIYSIEYSVEKILSKENDVFKPEYMKQVALFTYWLRSLEEVRHVSSFTDTLKRINKNMNENSKSEYKIPVTNEEIAQFILLYELSLPLGLDLNNQITMNKNASRIVVRFDDMSSSDIIKFQEKVRNWWGEYSNQYLITDASTTLMFTHITKRAIESMAWGTLLAFLLIAVILIFSLRSLKLGLVSIITNIVPIIVGMGVWALINGEVGMSFAIVVALTLGIVVDDTVHFLTKFQYAKDKLNYSAPDAIRHTFSTVGVALWITSIALIGGFMIMSTSSFSRNADMGLLSSITIALALLIDLMLLPALLILRVKLTVNEESIDVAQVIN
ncbi:MAG: putative RND superfamily exporter protein [Bermanella sp.]|jgi:predicted RND superfamily exporter protein